jgi:hypothetical protein
MRFRYVGQCASGVVQFTRESETVVMPEGDAVEVPGWLAAKLKSNSHFEAVAEEPAPEESAPEVVPVEAPKKRGRKPKAQTDDTGSP